MFCLLLVHQVKLPSSSGVGSGVGCTSGDTVGCSSKGDSTETAMGEDPPTLQSERHRESNIVEGSVGVSRKSTRERTSTVHFDERNDIRENTKRRQNTLEVKSCGLDQDTTVKPRPIKDSQGQFQWEVEKILEEKIMEDGTYMWVKWTG